MSSAAAVVAATDRPNGAVLVDTLHFARSDSKLHELDELPAERLPFVHLADAPAEMPSTTEGLIHVARSERLPSGDRGDRHSVHHDSHATPIPVALEVPMETLTREIGPESVARRVREAAGRVLANVQSKRRAPIGLAPPCDQG